MPLTFLWLNYYYNSHRFAFHIMSFTSSVCVATPTQWNNGSASYRFFFFSHFGSLSVSLPQTLWNYNEIQKKNPYTSMSETQAQRKCGERKMIRLNMYHQSSCKGTLWALYINKAQIKDKHTASQHFPQCPHLICWNCLLNKDLTYKGNTLSIMTLMSF